MPWFDVSVALLAMTAPLAMAFMVLAAATQAMESAKPKEIRQ